MPSILEARSSQLGSEMS